MALFLISLAGVLWFLYSRFHDSTRFLSGESISLIDEFKLEFIEKGPPKILLRTIPGEPLRNWQYVGSSRSGAIWKNHTEYEIAGDAKLLNGGTTFQSSQNVFLSETPINHWNWLGNQIWIKTGGNKQPEDGAYTIQYVAGKIPTSDKLIRENLVNPFHYGYIRNDSGEELRITMFGLKSPFFSNDSASVASNADVKNEDRVLRYEPQSFIPAPINNRLVYPSRNQPNPPQLQLSDSNPKFRQNIRLKSGRYALALFARPAGIDQRALPGLQVTTNGNETGLIVIREQDYQLYLLPFRSSKNVLHVEISLVDSNSSGVSKRNGVLIQSIEVWPDITGSRLLPDSWTLLQQNVLDLHRFDLSGTFTMRSTGQNFGKELYLPPGIAKIEIEATAQLSENAAPELRIYIDEIQAAGVQIKKDLQIYTVPLSIRGGLRKVKFAFHKDHGLREDDILYLNAVRIRYPDSVVVVEKLHSGTPEMDRHYVSQYPASANHGNSSELFYNNLANQIQQNGYRIGPISGYVDDQSEVRRALILPVNSEVAYPVIAHQNAQLLFATRALSDSTEKEICTLRFQILAGGFPGLTHTIFSVDSRSDEKDTWNDHSIDLGQLRDGKTILTFKTDAIPADGSCKMAIQISNPRIIVPHREEPSPLGQIVLVTFDSLRSDHLSLYGYKRKTTSSIDALARDGIQFDNVISQASWTLPSFGSLFTSLYPSFHQVVNKNSVLPAELFTLSRALKQQGYYNIAITNNPYLNPRFGFFRDFDEYHYGLKNREEHNQILLKTIEKIKGQKAFLFVHFIDPHIPCSPSPNHAGKFQSDLRPDRQKTYVSAFLANDTCQALEPSEIQSIVDCYDEEILSVDHHMELLITQMKRLRMYDNSLVIFGSDHGEEFQAHGTFFHGQSLYNDVLKVPLVIKLPKKFPKMKSRIQETVQMVDLMPTILDLLHISAPPYVNGASLVPLWNGGKFRKAEVIVSENSVSRQVSMISGKYKYIRNGRRQNCQFSVKEELYDLEQDPGERRNLSQNFPAVLELFRVKMLHFEQSANRFVKKRRLNNNLNLTEMDAATKQQLEALGYLQ